MMAYLMHMVHPGTAADQWLQHVFKCLDVKFYDDGRKRPIALNGETTLKF